MTFQSRFGRGEWLKPYTSQTLRELASQGVKRVAVLTPGFSADCLETLEEIGVENAGYFREAGGERYAAIRASTIRRRHGCDRRGRAPRTEGLGGVALPPFSLRGRLPEGLDEARLEARGGSHEPL